jgi:hypothetical protein
MPNAQCLMPRKTVIGDTESYQKVNFLGLISLQR